MRENALLALPAAAGAAAIAWLGLYGLAWNDYEVEVRPAYEALAAGHLALFLRLAPVYGGSLIERAPFALAPGLWHGGPLAVYRMAALPCLLASVALAVWLAARMRAAGSPALARAVAVGLCVANPITLIALEVGHPEELLGGALSVAALLLACSPSVSGRRTVAAGLLLGLAIANKDWAALVLPVALLALPRGRRLAFLACALGSAALIEAPLLLGSSAGGLAGVRAVASTGSAIFQPWQVWWFLGRHGALVHGLFGTPKPGYRIGPSFAGTLSHPVVIASALALGAWLAWRVRGARLAPAPALAALALTLLARCLLDTWDTGYYMLPALLALLAWEVEISPHRPPALALAASALAWASFQWLPEHVSADATSALFLAWTLPLAVLLALRLRPAGLRRGEPADGPAPQPMTVSSLSRPVRAWRPSGSTTTRSSIRTPSLPGR